MAKKTPKHPIFLSICTILIIILGFQYFQRSKQPSCMVSVNGECRWQPLAGEWKIFLPSNRLAAMQQIPVKVTAPLNFEDEIYLHFQGKDMYMGEISAVLKRTGIGIFEGEFILPACFTENMLWIGQITHPSLTDTLHFEVGSQ